MGPIPSRRAKLSYCVTLRKSSTEGLSVVCGAPHDGSSRLLMAPRIQRSRGISPRASSISSICLSVRRSPMFLVSIPAYASKSCLHMQAKYGESCLQVQAKYRESCLHMQLRRQRRLQASPRPSDPLTDPSTKGRTIGKSGCPPRPESEDRGCAAP